MPRGKGSRNQSDYKYKVTSGDEVKYYVSQKEIESEYDLKRTAIYFMIHSPERRKDHRGLTIEKLTEPLPVYMIVKHIDEDAIHIKYQKLVY